MLNIYGSFGLIFDTLFWLWQQLDLPKGRHLFTNRHGVTSQATRVFYFKAPYTSRIPYVCLWGFYHQFSWFQIFLDCRLYSDTACIREQYRSSSWICGREVDWKEIKGKRAFGNSFVFGSVVICFFVVADFTARCFARLFCGMWRGVPLSPRNSDGGYPTHFLVVGFKIKDKRGNLARQFLMFLVPWLVSWFFFPLPSYITQKKGTHIAYVCFCILPTSREQSKRSAPHWQT